MSLFEVVSNNEILFILLYCCIILYINISYLREHKEIKASLGTITEDEEKEMLWTVDSIAVMLFALAFNFFRRWLFYLIAVIMIDNIVVLLLAVTLFIIGLYDVIFNSSIGKLKKSNVGYYLAIIDTIFVFLYAIYIFVVM